MVKKPMTQQKRACKYNKRACAYDNEGFEEIHSFDDPLQEHDYILMVQDSYAGIMQGDTGKFYSLADKKVIDNPYSMGRCKDLGYK